MASLAGMLKARGHTVTGSDQNAYPPMSTQLEKLGIRVLEGYKPEKQKWLRMKVLVRGVTCEMMLDYELIYKFKSVKLVHW